MMSALDLERALDAAGLEAPVRFEEVTGSTNETALHLARSGSPEWTVVAAGHQTAGRGRLGRTWSDRAGRALMFSIVLRPTVDPDLAGLIPLLAGSAMAGAIAEVAGVEVRCKWPNDLLIGFEKVGGILVESSIERGRIRHAVLGVGVNLEPPPDIGSATGIGDVDAPRLLGTFLHRFHDGYARLPGDVVEAWSDVSATLGRDVRADRVEGVALRGKAVAVDGRGALVIETPDGRVAITSGEIDHLGD
jgi:BirA family transcriptional regulator, biotin operon repressor / biotin---[acetyl-CoA-carboxylase] ligase